MKTKGKAPSEMRILTESTDPERIIATLKSPSNPPRSDAHAAGVLVPARREGAQNKCRAYDAGHDE